MDVGANPYAPGAGTRPPVLAGRDDLVANATIALARARRGRHGKSFVAVGLRGVGKTVVLNRVLELAEAEKYQVACIEAHDSASLASLLVPQLRTIMLRIRADLISKGMVWSPSDGMTDFTVPLFDEFIRREMP